MASEESQDTENAAIPLGLLFFRLPLVCFLVFLGSCVLGLFGRRSLAAATGSLATATATGSTATGTVARHPPRFLHLAGAIHHQRLGRGRCIARAGFGIHADVGALAAAAGRRLATLRDDNGEVVRDGKDVL